MGPWIWIYCGTHAKFCGIAYTVPFCCVKGICVISKFLLFFGGGFNFRWGCFKHFGEMRKIVAVKARERDFWACEGEGGGDSWTVGCEFFSGVWNPHRPHPPQKKKKRKNFVSYSLLRRCGPTIKDVSDSLWEIQTTPLWANLPSFLTFSKCKQILNAKWTH